MKKPEIVKKVSFLKYKRWALAQTDLLQFSKDLISLSHQSIHSVSQEI